MCFFLLASHEDLLVRLDRWDQEFLEVLYPQVDPGLLLTNRNTH